MVATILVLLALVAGAVGLASLSTSGLLGSRSSGNSDDAQAVAEAAMANIVATLNQPQNRKILVAGTAMNSWASATGDTLQSPCIKNDGTRPGSNDGQPTTAAKNLGDGQFRDLVTNAVDTGDRRFSLRSITYAVGEAGKADRRSIRTTTAAGSGSLTKVNSGKFYELNNLDDPDGSGTILPGANSGFITLSVEGRVFRNGVQVATSTVTREFEVMPKCCGASFGSNGSGGTTVDPNNQAGSTGSDSRFCGVQFGIITGINGGTHWSFYANDRFTSRNFENKVVNISSMLGALKSGETLFQRSNCRVIPTASNGACSPSQSSQDQSYGTTIGKAAAGGVYGTKADIAGTTISGIPIVPINLSTLPSVATKYAFAWPTSGWVANRVLAAGSGFGGSDSTFLTLTSSGTTWRYFVRTNPGANPPTRANPPRVEICQVTTTTTCSSWSNVSDFRIADNFSSATYAGGISDLNLSPASKFASWAGTGWSGNWQESDASSSTSAGMVQIVSGPPNYVRIQPTAASSQTGWIRRGVDIQGYSGTKVRVNLTTQNLDSGGTADVPEFAFSTNNGSTWTTVTPSLAYSFITLAVTKDYVFTLPPAANATPTGGATTALIRMQLKANLNNEFMRVNSVEIAPSGGLDINNVVGSDSWCAYTGSAPVTLQPGFLCLGPQFNLGAGGSVIADTSGGPLTFYYNAATDTRATNLTFNAATDTFGYSSPLVSTNNGATIQHVVCPVGGTAAAPVLDNNCLTPVSETVYSAVGVPDRLNFFGRDTGATQAINIGSLSGTSTAPGKISGAWFYFPQGDLTLTVNGCADGSQPGDFYTNDNGWNFSGRIWVKNFKPCGAFHFRVPPSYLTNNAVFPSGYTFPGDVTYVDWSGVDWVARSASGSSSY